MQKKYLSWSDLRVQLGMQVATIPCNCFIKYDYYLTGCGKECNNGRCITFGGYGINICKDCFIAKYEILKPMK